MKIIAINIGALEVETFDEFKIKDISFFYSKQSGGINECKTGVKIVSCTDVFEGKRKVRELLKENGVETFLQKLSLCPSVEEYQKYIDQLNFLHDKLKRFVKAKIKFSFDKFSLANYKYIKQFPKSPHNAVKSIVKEIEELQQMKWPFEIKYDKKYVKLIETKGPQYVGKQRN